MGTQSPKPPDFPQSPPALQPEPKNEKRICAAVVRFIEQMRNEKLNEVDRPDQRDRNREAVELVLKSPTGRFAIEHTRIESYERQIDGGRRFVDLLGPMETALEGRLPEGKYDLIVDVDAAPGVPARDAVRIREVLQKWVTATAANLAPDGASDAKDRKWSITEKPDGVAFQVTLQRWHRPGQSKLLIKRFTPPELEQERRKRIATALHKKLPKLAAAKREFEAESILVLESDDIALANRAAIGDALRAVLTEHANLPDTIYLVETDRGLSWQLWKLKVGNHIFPDVPEDSGPFDVADSTDGDEA